MPEKPEPPSPRTLGGDIPELKDYLKPGMKVLDVGCGRGTITLGVAEAVSPGEVMGIDPVAENIDMARDWATEASSKGNVSFRSGDCHDLDLPDDTFDVVYSHTVTHFLLDPVRALEEQKRVAKPGGWVIASGVRDPGILTRYPPCPNWDAAWRALRNHHDSMQERFRSSGEDPQVFRAREMEQQGVHMFYFNHQAGRQCPGWFASAGLTDLRVAIKADHIQFPGAETQEPDLLDMLPVADPDPEQKSQLVMNLAFKELVEGGIIDQDTLDGAAREARNWYRDPQAFHYWVLVFVAGQV